MYEWSQGLHKDQHDRVGGLHNLCNTYQDSLALSDAILLFISCLVVSYCKACPATTKTGKDRQAVRTPM